MKLKEINIRHIALIVFVIVLTFAVLLAAVSAVRIAQGTASGEEGFAIIAGIVISVLCLIGINIAY